MNVRILAAMRLSDVLKSSPTVALCVGLVTLGGLFNREVAFAVSTWDTSTAYNHCFLVIPIVVFLLWDRRKVLLGSVLEPYPMAALAALPLALAWLVTERLGIMEGRQLVAMTFAELLFFVMLGPRLWWRLAGPLLYLYFLVPFGAFLTPKLQDITTIFIDHGLRFLHIPAYISGYTIEIPEGAFHIAEACAGLRFLIAAVAFGCLYALVMYRSPIRRAAFIGASIVVPIIANGFRALGTVAIGHVLGSAEAVETDHLLYGWLFFSIVIFLLIALGLPFREDTLAGTPDCSLSGPRSSDFRDHLCPAVFGAAGLIALAAIGPAIAVELNQRAMPDTLSGLPSLILAGSCRQNAIPLAVGLDAPGRMMVQLIDCGPGPVKLSIEVFSPRSIASRMLAEQRRLTDVVGADDVQSRPLSVPGSPPGKWRLVARTNPNRVAATSLWIEGKPVQLGLMMRARQAWHSIAGSPYSPVLVVLTPADAPDGIGPLAPDSAARAIAQFLQSQPDLGAFLARLSGPARVKG